MPEATNTTEMHVPIQVQMDMTPTPEPVEPGEGEEESGAVPFKDEVREAIFAKRRDMLNKEMADQGLEIPATGGEEPKEPEIISAQTPPETSPPASSPVEAPAPTQTAKTPEQEEFILNVYGKEQKLSKDQLIREAQKGLAATQIFQEGYRMRDEAQQIANTVKQNLQPAAPPAQAQTQNPQQSQPILDKEKAKEIAKRINYGSEEDQVNALIDLGATIESKVRGQAQPVLPPEQIVYVATQQAKAEIRAEQEQETLKREFAEIIADPVLAAATDVMAAQIANNYHQQGIPKTRVEVLREAGIKAKERFLAPALPPAPNPAPPQAAAPAVKVGEEKLERKRAAPKPPTTASKVAVEPPPQYGVGVSDVVNQMRKARGQSVLH